MLRKHLTNKTTFQNFTFTNMNKIKKKKSTHQLNDQTEKGVEIESDFAKATNFTLCQR